MIGQYVVGLTLVVNIVMRWPSLLPAALVVALATGWYEYRDSASTLVLAKPAAGSGRQANHEVRLLSGPGSSALPPTVNGDLSIGAGLAPTEVAVSFAAIESTRPGL